MSASKFHHNLARLRKHLGLSQSDAAELAGCSKTTIQSIELGRLSPSKALVAKLQGALGVPAEWLLSKDLESSIPEPLRLFQDGHLPYKFQLDAAGNFDRAISILKGLKSESEFALWQHYTFEYVKILSKSFAVDYPARGPFQALKHLRAFFDELAQQQDAALPKQKAKPVHRSKRSRTRQSA